MLSLRTLASLVAVAAAAALAACGASTGPAPATVAEKVHQPPPAAQDEISALAVGGFEHPQGLDWPAERLAKPAKEAFKSIQVLGAVPAARLMQGMQSMEQNLGAECDHCHVEHDFASDDKKPKQTARTMMKMALDVNTRFFGGRTHVTCYTCHRADTTPEPFTPTKPAPVWPMPPLAAADAEKPASQVYKSLQVLGGMPAGRLGEVMVSFSTALGVGCVHCHDPKNWSSDEKKTKETARAMLRMVSSIGETAFAGGKNPVRCATCHRGSTEPARAAGPMVRVAATLAGGAAAPRAALFLGAPGFAPANRKALRDMPPAERQKVAMGRMFHATEGELGHIAPGAYSLCVIALPEDPNPKNDPKGWERELSCAPLSVTATPDEQVVQRELPPL
jgi:hypothetical protein